MKKQLTIIGVLALFTYYSFAQNPEKKSDPKIKSEKEKAEAVKKLEAKIAVDETDPTFPKEELVKEKAQLIKLIEQKVKSK